MTTMTIKEFTEKYNNIATETLKNNFLRDNLHVKKYIPYLMKMTLADNLVNITILDKNTGNINVNSAANYLFFCRIIIEQYTDLKIESNEFHEEYDLLNEAGLLDKIMNMIPEKEITEFKMIIDMKKNDIMINRGTPQAFINQQVERFGTLLGVTLKPVLEKISNQLENLDEKDIEKLGKAIERAFKRFK